MLKNYLFESIKLTFLRDSIIRYFILLYFLNCSGQVLLYDDNQVFSELEIKELEFDFKKMLKTNEVYSISVDNLLKLEMGIPKNNYMSLATYWWPNPSSSNGMPYIGRDGEANPERLLVDDFEKLKKLAKDVREIVIYSSIDNDSYDMSHLENVLKTWFIDSATRMEPNLNFAQVIKGRNKFRIESTLEGMYLMEIAYYVSKVEMKLSPLLINELRVWYGALLNWYFLEKVTEGISSVNNNIKTAYYMQVICFNDFVKDVKYNNVVDDIINVKLSELLKIQFGKEGDQLLELKRTKSASYSVSNIVYWTNIYILIKTRSTKTSEEIYQKIKGGVQYIRSNNKLNDVFSKKFVKESYTIDKIFK